MNASIISAECEHRMHSACFYEDCACLCHLRDLFDWEPQTESELEEENDAKRVLDAAYAEWFASPEREA